MSRVLVVTGANGLLGRAVIAEALNRGMNVVGTTRSASDPPETGLLRWLPSVDLTNLHDVARFAALIEDLDAPIDLVHCVGYFPPLAEHGCADLAHLVETVDRNLTSAILVANLVLQPMVDHGGGALIMFGCHGVDRDYPLMVAFSAAKKAIEVLMRGLASEYADCGVIPVALAPASVDSHTERARFPKGDFDSWLRPNEVARRVLELIDTRDLLIAGNTIHLFRHSRRYFRDGFLTRVGETDS